MSCVSKLQTVCDFTHCMYIFGWIYFYCLFAATLIKFLSLFHLFPHTLKIYKNSKIQEFKNSFMNC